MAAPSDFRYIDRWQGSIQWAMPATPTPAVDLLEERDIDLEQYLVRAMWQMPWGQVGRAETSASDQTGITTGSDLTGLSVDVAEVKNREYRITFGVSILSVTTAGTVVVYGRREGSNEFIGIRRPGLTTVSQTGPGVGLYRATATSTVTWTVYALTDAGTLTISNSLDPGFLVVEDIGPYGAPA